MTPLEMQRTLALTRLESSDAVRSPWLSFTVIIDATVVAVPPAALIGLLWPAIVGTVSVLRAAGHLRRSDAVA